MHDRQEDVDVGARFDLQEQGGMLHQRHAARVEDDDVRAALGRAHHFIADHRVRFGRVRAGNKDTVRVANLADRVGHCATSEGLHEACNG
jgi:hypothetical protein